MEHLFKGTPKEKGGMQSGTTKSIDMIARYIKPLLNDRGFDIEFLRGENVHEFRKLSDYANWSKMVQRFLPKGSGLLTRIFYIEDPSYAFISQNWAMPNYTNSKVLQDKPRLSIPKDIMDKTTTEQRTSVMWGICKVLEWHFFIYDYLHYKFALAKFTDIPIEGWDLTDRFRPGDRMHIKPDYQLRLFKSISHLEFELIMMLNIK